MFDLACGDEAETFDPPQDSKAPLWALFANGPTDVARRFLPPNAVLRIGRSPDCGLVLRDPSVSRHHALLRGVGGSFSLEDLGSSNGTFANGQRLIPRQAQIIDFAHACKVGGTSVLVGPSGLSAPDPRMCLALADLADPVGRGGALPPDGMVARAWTLLRIQTAGPLPDGAAEAISTAHLASREVLFVRTKPTELFAVLADADLSAPRSDPGALAACFAGWSVEATIEMFDVPGGPNARREMHALMAGDALGASDGQPVILRDTQTLHLREMLKRVSPANVNVLLLGETGVGKEVFASLIHELSARRRHPFVRLNCATLSEHLLESELFGHERGAFTGAATTKIGLLETADRGTILFDEIGELSLPLQAKLLRVIESREILRVGGQRPIPLDVRFIAATNRDLTVEVAAGRFRQDLYFRLNCVTVTVPPLRERTSEIGPLASLFLARARRAFSLGPLALSLQALEALLQHQWPGNVRELKNTIERAALLATGPTILASQLGIQTLRGLEPPLVQAAPTAPASPPATTGDASPEPAERRRIEEALLRSAGNQGRAATQLGISRRTLVRRLARFGIPRPRVGPTGDPPAGEPSLTSGCASTSS
jgi:two-component system response regulator AtoC